MLQMLLALIASLIGIGSGSVDARPLSVPAGSTWFDPRIAHDREGGTPFNLTFTTQTARPQFLSLFVVLALSMTSVFLLIMRCMGRMPRKLVVSVQHTTKWRNNSQRAKTICRATYTRSRLFRACCAFSACKSITPIAPGWKRRVVNRRSIVSTRAYSVRYTKQQLIHDYNS